VSIGETLGVLAHCGGLVVDRPELTVGVVRAVSRTTGLELELIARRPRDRPDIPAPAPRHLLPVADEGIDLRVGWLDADGRAHWEYGSTESSSGPGFGVHGSHLRTRLRFPPLFIRVSVVLAWPEIGFPETVVDLPLPDGATVDRADVSIWDAPVDTGPVPDRLEHGVAPFPSYPPVIESGRIVAGPRVLHRGGDAVVVLQRLTVVGSALCLEVLSVARGDPADAVRSTFFPARPVRGTGEPAEIRANAPGAAIAVLRDGAALWLQIERAAATGGSDGLRTTAEHIVDRGWPHEGVLPLIIGWPAAGLVDVSVDLALHAP
jgi:hypothetical protein